MILSTPDDVLSFWFGTSDRTEMLSVAYISDRMAIWFSGKSKEFDNIQRENSMIIHHVAGENIGDEWLSPRGTLARVILLDQFSRCVYRGTSGSFQYDNLTARLVQELLKKDWLLTQYIVIERFFLGVAIQHCESLEMQELGVEIAAQLTSDATDDVKLFFSSLKGYPHEHYDVIRRFGRFPSRNAALGRSSTEEELEWVSSPECPAWAKTQLPSTPGDCKVLRVGVIAFGLSGRVFHAPFILTHPRFRLTAVYERSKNESQHFAEKHGIKVDIVRSVGELLSRKDVDVIVVCSPIEFHFEHARLALEAGKHVLMEKAFCASSTQAKDLLEMASNRGLVCLPYQNRRYDSDFLTIQSILCRLGRVVEYNGYFNRFSPRIREWSWKDTVAGSGGNFLSLGSHMIDQAVVLFGTPARVWADIRAQRPGGTLDDSWEVHLFYEPPESSPDAAGLHRGGFRAILKGSLLCVDHRIRYMIHGSEGSWRKEGMDTQEAELMSGKLPDYRAAQITEKGQLDKDTITYGCEPEGQWGELTTADGSKSKTPPRIGSYHILYDEFYDCVVHGKTPHVDPYVAVIVLRIIEVAKESSRLGQVLQFEI
mmetsp:Transcript_23109/g.33855  ORF Transcript_23109/g.33855 Transcript_23109/m.33855 type:complete len:596 (-) Transcript_23109:38-1825(-)